MSRPQTVKRPARSQAVVVAAVLLGAAMILLSLALQSFAAALWIAAAMLFLIALIVAIARWGRSDGRPTQNHH